MRGGGHTDRRRAVGVRVAVVAVIASITQIALTVAFTSLTFRDELSGELGLGLAAMFIGMLLTATVVGIRSGLPGHVVSPQDGGLVVLSVVAPTIAATADAPGETIVVLMGLSSLAVGLTMVALGRSGLGRMIRYLPYPVLAGFLAGTGLVMAQGTYALAFRGISGDATGGGERVARFAVVITVAVLMTAISRSSLPNERFVPPVVVGSIAAYHMVAIVADLGRTEGASRGWLLPELPGGALVDAGTFTVAAKADWGAVATHAPALLPLLILAPLTVLLYLGAFESILEAPQDHAIYGTRLPTVPTGQQVSCGPPLARVAELADAQDSGSCVRKDVRVQVPPRAPVGCSAAQKLRLVAKPPQSRNPGPG